jgi:hypothetical protein
MNRLAYLLLLLVLVSIVGVVFGALKEGFEEPAPITLFGYGKPDPCKPDEMIFLDGNGKMYCKKM